MTGSAGPTPVEEPAGRGDADGSPELLAPDSPAAHAGVVRRAAQHRLTVRHSTTGRPVGTRGADRSPTGPQHVLSLNC